MTNKKDSTTINEIEQIKARAFKMHRNAIDARYFNTLRKFFKPTQIVAIINDTRDEYEGRISHTQLLNLTNDHYRKERD